jgi:hypothetical protein
MMVKDLITPRLEIPEAFFSFWMGMVHERLPDIAEIQIMCTVHPDTGPETFSEMYK